MDTNERQTDERFMRLALAEAEKAAAINEVPIGAVLRYGDNVIAAGFNLKETKKDPTAHAEIIVLREASKRMGTWRLLDTVLYVTLEPCVMCCGALVHSRVARLVYGAKDPKGGAVDSLYDIVRDQRLNHRLEVTDGILDEECGGILTDFFRKKRES